MLLKEALNSWFITLMERSSWSSQQLISKYKCLGNSLEVQWLGLCFYCRGTKPRSAEIIVAMLTEHLSCARLLTCNNSLRYMLFCTQFTDEETKHREVKSVTPGHKMNPSEGQDQCRLRKD